MKGCAGTRSSARQPVNQVPCGNKRSACFIATNRTSERIGESGSARERLFWSEGLIAFFIFPSSSVFVLIKSPASALPADGCDLRGERWQKTCSVGYVVQWLEIIILDYVVILYWIWNSFSIHVLFVGRPCLLDGRSGRGPEETVPPSWKTGCAFSLVGIDCFCAPDDSTLSATKPIGIFFSLSLWKITKPGASAVGGSTICSNNSLFPPPHAAQQSGHMDWSCGSCGTSRHLVIYLFIYLLNLFPTRLPDP